MDHQDDRPATKADIRRVEGKIDGAVYGLDGKIGESVRGLDGKIDRLNGRLDESVRRLATEIVRLDVKIDTKVDALDVKLTSKLDQVLSVVQNFAGKLDSYGAGQALHGHVLTEAQVQLKDHERRIGGLENRFQ
ncbi:MAG TPA: hypothetical protein VH309_01905 [Elusimicrobiota bacterium]|jgi:hypothetical protein|nr:hypothetical protein [Elusimicrobiota bacterium]